MPQKYYTKEDLDKPVNDNETLREYIKNSENELGMDPSEIDTMKDSELNEYIEFIDYLWTK